VVPYNPIPMRRGQQPSSRAITIRSSIGALREKIPDGCGMDQVFPKFHFALV
jgi:hypothetical protein